MAHQQPGPPTPGPSGASWGGDGTLHAYCYDYMVKRGWTATASAFAADAGIIESEWQGPPIEAPQGLLYEWWAVFWDVFVARSQKTGQRNIHADNYVEAVRVKREPLVINFAGPNPPAPITMPRSLSHSSRPLGGPPGPRPNHTHPGQLHVLEQQQLQQQMQQGRQPMPGQRPMNGPPSQQYHLQAPPPPPGPPIQHMQGASPHPPHLQHPQGPPPPQQGVPTYPPGGGMGQPLMHSYQPPSAQSSPHLQHAQHPYANGRPQGGPGGPPPPPSQMRQQISMQQEMAGINPMSPAYGQAMQVVGLVGRDPESLNGDEQNAVAAQMRRAGVLPPLPPSSGQQPPPHMRAQQARAPSQRMHPDQQPTMGRPPYPPQGMTPQQQMHERQAQQQQILQQQQREREHFAQQQSMRGPQGGPPQMQYNPSQVGSPASPNYSAASPYATPLSQHMSIPPSQGQQGSPQAFPPPLPPPSRATTAAKTRGAANKMSPAATAPKRGGPNLEDPSPRSRKRARGGTKDEEMMGPETPNFGDGSGPPSPGGIGLGMPPGQYSQGGPMPPYRPSPSPSQQLQDQSTRGALDALQISASQNARMLAHQAQQQAEQQQYGQGGGQGGHGGHGGSGEFTNGDMGPGQMMNGHSNGISRPGSSTGYLQPPPNGSNNASSPGAGNPNTNGGGAGNGPSPRVGSPSLRIALPPPPTNLLAPTTDATPGGTARPFAGAAQSATPVPPPSELPPPGGAQNGDLTVGEGPYNFTPSGEDMYADLSLDFPFEDFLADGAFKDDLSGGMS